MRKELPREVKKQVYPSDKKESQDLDQIHLIVEFIPLPIYHRTW